MIAIIIGIIIYSFIAGIYYGVTADSEEAFLWIIFLPLNVGKAIVGIFKD